MRYWKRLSLKTAADFSTAVLLPQRLSVKNKKNVTDVTYVYFYYVTYVCSRYNVHSDWRFVELEVQACSGPADIFKIFIYAFFA